MDDYKFIAILLNCGWKRSDPQLPEFYVKKWSNVPVTRLKYSTVLISNGVIHIRTQGRTSLILNKEYNVDCTEYEDALATILKIQSDLGGKV